MKEDIVLVGGGGHCHSCIEVIESTEKFRIIGILELPGKISDKVLNYEVIGEDDDIPDLAKKIKNFFVTAGQIKSSELRIKLFHHLTNARAHLPTIIAPTAHVSSHAIICSGTIIHHHAFINANVNIGKGCIINTGAIIEHDSIIEDYCHVSTNATVNGGVTVESKCLIGSSSVIREGITIGHNSIIGFGTKIFRNIEPGSLIKQ